MRRNSLRIFSVIGAALMAAACWAQVDPAKTVLIVNGDQIKGDEYYRRMEFLPDVGRLLGSGGVAIYPPGFLTIVQLINDRLMLQLAKQKNLVPTDEEIDNTIKQSEAADPGFEQTWINSGRTNAELRRAVQFQLIEFKLTTEGVTVSDQEVEDFYHTKNEPGLTRMPREVKLSLIAVRDEAGEKTVDDNLSAGKNFGDVAKQDSVDATSARNGELGFVFTERLPQPVIDAVDKTKIGDITGWVDVQVGPRSDDPSQQLVAHVKYLIEDKKPEAPIPFTDVLKERIRRKMMLDKSVGKNSLEKELSDLRKTSKIQIESPEFAKMYEAFMKKYFNEDVHTAANGQ